MTPSPSMLTAAAIALGILWVLLAFAVLASLRQVRPLSRVLDESEAQGLPDGPLPRLSVVVTARDEAAGIEATVRRILDQTYPALEVLVVDDRSTDGTSAILARLAEEEDEAARRTAAPSRLSVVRIDTLPAGWLGKVHACHEGALRAGGDFILFMDGDVTLAGRDLLERVVALAERLWIDHVALVPDSRPMSALQAGLMGVFGQVYLAATLGFEMRRDRRRGGGGIGAFNLIRRSAYARIGGHGLVRLDVTDDFKIGRLLKESGARQRFYDGSGMIHCRWHEGVLNVIGGLEKNYFASFDFQVLKVIAFTLAAVAVEFAPAALAIPGLSVARYAPVALQAIAVAAFAHRQAPGLGVSPVALALLHPVGVVLLLAAAWNSMLRTLLRGGVRWRETFYPIAELRRGLVPPGAGRRLGPA